MYEIIYEDFSTQLISVMDVDINTDLLTIIYNNAALQFAT